MWAQATYIILLGPCKTCILRKGISYIQGQHVLFNEEKRYRGVTMCPNVMLTHAFQQHQNCLKPHILFAALHTLFRGKLKINVSYQIFLQLCTFYTQFILPQ